MKVGDRIKILSLHGAPDHFYSVGAEGEIVRLHNSDGDFMVKFDKGKFNPNCDGKWYVDPIHLVAGSEPPDAGENQTDKGA